MRKYFIIILMLFATKSFCQFSVDYGLGASTDKVAINKLAIKFQSHDVFAEVGYLLPFSSEVKIGTYINGRIGYTYYKGIFYLQPSLGYSYILRSTDRKYLNQYAMLYGIQFGSRKNGTGFFAETDYSSNTLFFLLGVSTNITK